MERVTRTAMYDDELGELIKSRAMTSLPEGYRMQLNAGDYQVVAIAWNMGIDSHLEAFTQSTATPDGSFVIAPGELHVLVRRLMDDIYGHPGVDEEMQERADSLASAICDHLKIELC